MCSHVHVILHLEGIGQYPWRLSVLWSMQTAVYTLNSCAAGTNIFVQLEPNSSQQWYRTASL